MKAANKLKRMLVLSVVFVFLALCCLFVPSAVSCASLNVWTDDGQQHIHDLAILEHILFSGDQLRIVTAYCTHEYPLESINQIDFNDYPTGIEDSEDITDIVKAVHLFQNYPNPFNPSTKIDFKIPVNGRVELKIFSVKGRLVRTLVERDMMAGPQSVRWDGCNDLGNRVSSGVYFYSLKSAGMQESRKMVLLR